MTKIAFASDHAGYHLKEELKAVARQLDHVVIDLGTKAAEPSVDYPDYGHAAANALASGEAEIAVVICGSGVGISIAANRHAHVRAALCQDVKTAILARQYNNANVLALGARLLSTETAIDVMKAFLAATFEGGRHVARVAKLSQ
jgi:ribose 5-phosphate isomerase B